MGNILIRTKAMDITEQECPLSKASYKEANKLAIMQSLRTPLIRGQKEKNVYDKVSDKAYDKT
jgi:hypothetical protein